MTLNELIQDVLLEARNNNIAESEKLSRRQIELWIKTYRSFLIKQDLDKGRTINPLYTQTIRMYLNRIENELNHFEYVGDKELPQLIDFNYRPGIITVKDTHGHLIQFGSETKMKFQKYRKYTDDDYIAYLKDNKIYVESKNNLLEYIDVQIIAEDPTEIILCYNPDEDQYPLPGAMWTTVKQLIFTRDIPTMIQMPSDTTNNSNDDTQNISK